MAMFTDAVAQANALRAGVAEDEARRLVGAAITAGAMIPALETWAVDLCTKNVPAFRVFLAATGPALVTIFASGSQFDRTHRNGGDASDALTDMERRIAAQLDLPASAYSAVKSAPTKL